MEKPAEILATRRNGAIALAEEKTRHLHSLCPEIVEIDRELSQTAYELFDAACDRYTFEKKAGEIREKVNSLRRERGELTTRLGFAEDYDAPRFECAKCCDTGYVKLDKCSCLKALEAKRMTEGSMLGKGLGQCTFDNFSLELCTDGSMKTIYDYCVGYAEDFSPESGNLLFYGGPGLGKTHLAAAISNAVISKGYYVVFETSQKIVTDRRKVEYTSDASAADRYYDCMLLVIDDLGTEAINDFNVAAIMGIIDGRLNSGKPTIISTNFDLNSLNKAYGVRMTSRILGEFTPYHFSGKDVRMLKIKD